MLPNHRTPPLICFFLSTKRLLQLPPCLVARAINTFLFLLPSATVMNFPLLCVWLLSPPQFPAGALLGETRIGSFFLPPLPLRSLVVEIARAFEKRRCLLEDKAALFPPSSFLLCESFLLLLLLLLLLSSTPWIDIFSFLARHLPPSLRGGGGEKEKKGVISLFSSLEADSAQGFPSPPSRLPNIDLVRKTFSDPPPLPLQGEMEVLSVWLWRVGFRASPRVLSIRKFRRKFLGSGLPFLLRERRRERK